MPIQLPSPADMWAALTKNLGPKQRKALGWILIAVAPVVFALVIVAYFDSTIEKWVDKLWERQPSQELTVVILTPFENEQRDEDRRHAGDVCVQRVEWGDVAICMYGDDCVLVRHTLDGNVSRTWKIHPRRYGAPPTDHEVESVSAAGLPDITFRAIAGPLRDDRVESIGSSGGGRCRDVDRHEGIWMPESWVATEHRCWIFRFGRFFDGNMPTDECVLRVPFNDCSNYYGWPSAEWVSCVHL